MCLCDNSEVCSAEGPWQIASLWFACPWESRGLYPPGDEQAHPKDPRMMGGRAWIRTTAGSCRLRRE